MRGTVETKLILEFLTSKGFGRIIGEPFAFCRYGSGLVIIAVDEEYSWQDLNILEEDWTNEGAKSLFNELVQWLEEPHKEN